MRAIAVQESIEVSAPSGRAFEALCRFDAVSIIKKHGVLPGVASVAGQTAAWSAPGQQRLLTLTDGASVRETLTDFGAASYDYRVEDFTGPIAGLVAHARGRFEAAPEPGAAARITWRYEFTPSSAAAAPLLRFFVSALWPGYMRAALRRLKESIESTRPQ
jgi:hypothetical protein